MASTRRRSLASACARRSVDVSTRIDRTAAANPDGGAGSSSSMAIEGRVRRSRGSVERHTAQSQPIEGTPWEVPLPSTVTLRFNNQFPGAGRLDKPQTQLVENLLENLTLLGGQVAPRLL